MVERPTFPWDAAVGKDRPIMTALGAIFQLLLQMADTLDAIQRDQ